MASTAVALLVIDPVQLQTSIESCTMMPKRAHVDDTAWSALFQLRKKKLRQIIVRYMIGGELELDT